MKVSTDLPATGAITPPGDSFEETLLSFNKDLPTPSPTTEKENGIDGIWQQVADQCHCSLDEIEDVYACTALQEAMIALTFKDPRAYTIEHEYRLPREVDHHKLQEAWNTTAQANPILRTRMIPTSQLGCVPVSYTHLRAHETDSYLVCRLLLEKKKYAVFCLKKKNSFFFFFFLMIRRQPRSTHCISSAASDVYKRQE